MACYEINGIVPVVDPTACLYPPQTLIGDVISRAGPLRGAGR